METLMYIIEVIQEIWWVCLLMGVAMVSIGIFFEIDSEEYEPLTEWYEIKEEKLN